MVHQDRALYLYTQIPGLSQLHDYGQLLQLSHLSFLMCIMGILLTTLKIL